MDTKQDPACIFCKIIAKQIPANIVSEGEEYVAFRDISPQAPTHILVLPREHCPNITEMRDPTLLGTLFRKATSIAEAENLKDGFRLVVNTGTSAGQTVFHLHIHILGGRNMHWPPG